MAESRSFSAETWASDREAFIFRFHDYRFGDLATFFVPESTLKELRPDGPFRPESAFDALRPLIYEAALEHIRTGSSMSQHVVTPHELRELWAERHVLPEINQAQQGAK
jgi:hypothetical protein